VTYHLEQNDGPNTLHSGTHNCSFKFWNLTDVTESSIPFSIYDDASETGMPEAVQVNVTYKLTERTWKIRVQPVAVERRTRVLLLSTPFYSSNPHRQETSSTDSCVSPQPS
jgi:aldose 1-epimerase